MVCCGVPARIKMYFNIINANLGMRKVAYITSVYDFFPNDLSTTELEAKISKFS